jgi:hypothetical protein
MRYYGGQTMEAKAIFLPGDNVFVMTGGDIGVIVDMAATPLERRGVGDEGVLGSGRTHAIR